MLRRLGPTTRALSALIQIAALPAMVAVTRPLLAQADRATIEGVVSDMQSGPIAGSRVVVVRIETNDEIVISTNASGRYFVPNLPLGTYSVSAQKEGFQRAQFENLRATSQSTLRADFTLQLNSISTRVEVYADNSILDQSTPAIVGQLSTEQIRDSPIIVLGRKRDITAYLQLLPGVTTASTWGARVNGSNPGNSEVFVDGAPSSQTNVRGSIQENGPAVEHVGEFSVIANSFNAEFGRTGSWFTNVVIRSGTNQVHGSVFDYLNNDGLNARSFFQRTRTRVRQNEGGFTLGAPLYLPKLYRDRNRTFFFFGQQLVYWNQSATGTILTAPRADFRQGDFSRLLSASAAIVPIFDPNTTRQGLNGEFFRDPFPGNVIPQNRISPVSQRMLALVPMPDLPDLQTANFYSRTGGGKYRDFVSTLKIDHRISQRHRLAVTYSDQYNPRIIAGQGWGLDSPLEGSQSPKSIHDRTGRLNYDYVIRSNLLNHLTIGVDRYLNETRQLSQFQGWNEQLGIRGVVGDQGAFPMVTFTGGVSSPRALGGPDFSLNASGRMTITEVLSWTIGRHSIKLGGNWWPEYANAHEGYLSSGNFVFSNLTTSQPNSTQYTAWGSSFASFLLGDLSSAAVAEPYTRGARFRSGGAFVQDQWRTTAKLTLSYALRWEWNAAPSEPHGSASGFDPHAANPAASGRMGALMFAGSGAGRSGSNTLSNGWYRGFGPRLGLAYALTPKTVLKGSFSVYYAPGFRTRLIGYGFNNAYALTSPTGYAPAYNWNSSFPQDFARAPFIDASYQNDQNVSSILPDSSRMPQIVSWTASIERAITTNLAVEAAYVGTHSTHLILSAAQSNLNTLDARYLSLGSLLFQDVGSPAALDAGIVPPYPGFANQRNRTVGQALRPYPQYLDVTEEWGPHGIARFHSLQLKLTKRYSSGITLLASYTWSKNMTNVEGGPIDLGPSDGSIQNPGRRAGEVSVSTDGPPHVLVVSGTYELPFGRTKRFLNSGIVARFAEDWRVTVYCRYTDGLPLAITSGNPLASFGYPAIRANYTGGPVYRQTDPRAFDPAQDVYLNASAFTTPPTFQIGNTARVLDWVRGFSQKSEAVSAAKSTPLGDHLRGILRADLQNPFNFARWNNPNTNITSSQFGKVTGAAPGRSIQLSLSLQF